MYSHCTPYSYPFDIEQPAEDAALNTCYSTDRNRHDTGHAASYSYGAAATRIEKAEKVKLGFAWAYDVGKLENEFAQSDRVFQVTSMTCEAHETF